MDYSVLAQKFCKALEGRESRKVTKLLDDGFKGMYVILRIVRNSSGEVLAGDIAKRMDISTARVAAALNSLCRKGYVERIPASDDGRKTVVRITPSGEQALSEREKTVYNLVETLLKKLTEEEALAFIDTFEKLFR